MSDFQKQTLKKWARNFLIVCGFGLLVYCMVKFELVRYAVLAILTLIAVGGSLWAQRAEFLFIAQSHQKFL